MFGARAISSHSSLGLAIGLVCFLSALVGLFTGSAAIANVQSLPVPRVAIYPGDAIGPEHLDQRLFRSVASQMPIFVSPDALIGKVARRTLLPGQPVPFNAVREPHVITQGKAATVVFQAGGLTITGLGIALQSAGIGDVVSVRNADSGTVIRGIVQNDGSIRVGFQ